MLEQDKIAVIRECIDIIRGLQGHASVYTTYDDGVAHGVKDDAVKAICSYYNILYEPWVSKEDAKPRTY